jgi:hypothetical protein
MWRGFPVRFYTNVLGKNYSLVGDASTASTFDTPDQATEAAQLRNLQPADYTIQNVSNN